MKPSMTTMLMVQKVINERHRQYEKFGDDNPMTTGSDLARLAILGEEFGEVAKENCECQLGNADPLVWEENLQKELIQVAAVSVAWAEQLEPRVQAAKAERHNS